MTRIRHVPAEPARPSPESCTYAAQAGAGDGADGSAALTPMNKRDLGRAYPVNAATTLNVSEKITIAT